MQIVDGRKTVAGIRDKAATRNKQLRDRKSSSSRDEETPEPIDDDVDGDVLRQTKAPPGLSDTDAARRSKNSASQGGWETLPSSE